MWHLAAKLDRDAHDPEAVVKLVIYSDVPPHRIEIGSKVGGAFDYIERLTMDVMKTILLPVGRCHVATRNFEGVPPRSLEQLYAKFGRPPRRRRSC